MSPAADRDLAPRIPRLHLHSVDPREDRCEKFFAKIQTYLNSVKSAEKESAAFYDVRRGDIGLDNTMPLRVEVLSFRESHGRRWCPSDTPRGRPYYFPIDLRAMKQMSRENLIVCGALDGRYHVAPVRLDANMKVIDIGCGRSFIWILRALLTLRRSRTLVYCHG